jgi:hypothetical protein
MQIVRHVTALASLLREAASRLCPPVGAAATDAALSLLSGIRAAQLRLAQPPGSQAVSALEHSRQELLQALQCGLSMQLPGPPKPLAACQPPVRQADPSRHEELSRLVRKLGFGHNDWQAAQANLAMRTVAAMQPTATFLPTAADQRLPPLDSLLQAAVTTPPWSDSSGKESPLHAAVQRLLWLLQRLPFSPGRPAGGTPALQLTDQGWAAYWTLEPLVSGAAAAATDTTPA